MSGVVQSNDNKRLLANYFQERLSGKVPEGTDFNVFGGGSSFVVIITNDDPQKHEDVKVFFNTESGSKKPKLAAAVVANSESWSHGSIPNGTLREDKSVSGCNVFKFQSVVG